MEEKKTVYRTHLGTLLIMAIAVIAIGFYNIGLTVVVGFFAVAYYYSRKIELTEKEVIFTSGMVNRKVTEIPYKKINNIERIAGLTTWGTIKVYSGNDAPIVMVNVEKSQEIKKRVKAMID